MGDCKAQNGSQSQLMKLLEKKGKMYSVKSASWHSSLAAIEMCELFFLLISLNPSLG